MKIIPKPAKKQWPSLIAWSPAEIEDGINEFKRNCQWEQASGSTKKWAAAVEVEFKNKPGILYRLLGELCLRKATLDDLFLAYVYSNTENIQANFDYLDYKKAKVSAEERAEYGATKEETLYLGRTDTQNWQKEMLKKAIVPLKTQIQFSEAMEKVRKEWESMEQNNLNLAFAVAEELVDRKATLAEYYRASMFSNSDDPTAVLPYLDFCRIRDAEQMEATTKRIVQSIDTAEITPVEDVVFIEAHQASPREDESLSSTLKNLLSDCCCGRSEARVLSVMSLKRFETLIAAMGYVKQGSPGCNDPQLRAK